MADSIAPTGTVISVRAVAWRRFATYLSVFVSVAIATTLLTQMVAASDTSTDEPYGKVAPSVVYIESKSDTDTVRANGFLLRKGVLVVPLYFVKEGWGSGKSVTVKPIQQDESYTVDEVIASDTERQIAFLRATQSIAQPLTLSDQEPKVGSKAYVIGNHLYKIGTVTKDQDHPGRIRIVAPVSPGCAGSAVADSTGRVIGIVQAGSSTGGYITLPAADLSTVLSRIK